MNPKRLITRIATVSLAVILCAATIWGGVYAMKAEQAAVPVLFTDSSILSMQTLEPIITAPQTDIWVDRAPVFQKPEEMRAVFVTPGVDFLLEKGAGSSVWRGEIDAMIEQAIELEMNTLVVETERSGKVIFSSKVLPMFAETFDALQYCIEAGQEAGLFVYATYGVMWEQNNYLLTPPKNLDAGTLQNLTQHAQSFCREYQLDGVVLTDFYMEDTPEAYLKYRQSAAGGGFEAFLPESAEACLRAVVAGFRSVDPNRQVGIRCDGVWANIAEHELGSETTASFQSLVDGHADTKRYVEDKLADFVFVEMFGSLTSKSVSFETVAAWWNDTFEGTSIPFYAVQASEKACTDETGWASPDQLTRQLIKLAEFKKFEGTSFSSLGSLMDNPSQSTDALVAYFRNETTAEHILKVLTITKPDKQEFITNEPTIQFLGASDPSFEVLYNGKAIETNENGYFSVEADLAPGVNTFTFSHKSKVLTYTITREVKVISNVAPIGNLVVYGNTGVTVSAYAYEGAVVTATLNGVTIALSRDDILDDETNLESHYQKYSGTFTVPPGTASQQHLGSVTFTASWEGFTGTATGATVTVNRQSSITEIGNGSAVRITATEAETFPVDTLNDNSTPTCYPLPSGTIDYLASDLLTFGEFSYYNLQSGRRVYASDVEALGEQRYGDNQVTGMGVRNTGTYTELSFQNLWHVPYSISLSPLSHSGGENYSLISFSPTSLTITFHYTVSAVQDMPSFSMSPLFSSASWSSAAENGNATTKLTLTFRNPGTFQGLSSAYSSDGVLTLRFNNPLSLYGTTIVIDPGHGGSDPGAVSPVGITEAEMNQTMAGLVSGELRALGANTLILQTSGGMTLAQRVAAAKSNGNIVFLSIHHNSGSSTAYGPETYYFNSFSMPLAKAVYQQLNSAASSIYSGTGVSFERAFKFYRFRVTLPQNFPSILIEYGFLSNPNEAMNLLHSSTQQSYARATAQGVANYFSQLSGSSGYATESSSVGVFGGGLAAPMGDEDDEW